MTLRWRGRDYVKREQVANARDRFVDLSPASAVPALAVAAAWSALQQGQEVPLIGEPYEPDPEDDTRF